MVRKKSDVGGLWQCAVSGGAEKPAPRITGCTTLRDTIHIQHENGAPLEACNPMALLTVTTLNDPFFSLDIQKEFQIL